MMLLVTDFNAEMSYWPQTFKWLSIWIKLCISYFLNISNTKNKRVTKARYSIDNVSVESLSIVFRSSSPWGSRGTRVLNEPQLSAQPCRQSTGRPWSGPHTVPLISPQGTWTRRSDSRQTRPTINTTLFLTAVYDTYLTEKLKTSTTVVWWWRFWRLISFITSLDIVPANSITEAN